MKKEEKKTGSEKKAEGSVSSGDLRDKTVIRTGIISIITNILLASFKAAVGLVSNSIAVVLDAVNNLSDALSSVITVIGTKLAGRQPDKKHPFGYGRIEYLSATVVAVLVLYAGITSAVESVKKIITPESADYSTVSLIIIAVAVAVKIILGLYVRKKGKQTGSAALAASGTDALFDAILSGSVLASAIIFILSGISLEAYVGVLISVIIIKSGFEMLRDTVSDILGQRADAELTTRIREILTAEPDVHGAYDLFLYNYGPDKNYGSVHLELPDTMTVSEVDKLTRRVQGAVYHETGVILTGIGVYSYNTGDDESARIRNDVQKIVMSHDWALGLHGFFIDAEKKDMRFDVVVSFDVNAKEVIKDLYAEVSEAYPDFTIFIAHDVDVSD